MFVCSHIIITVRFLNKDTFGASQFVLYREVVLFGDDFCGVCIHEYFWLVLCLKVCPLSGVLYQSVLLEALLTVWLPPRVINIIILDN